MVWLLPLFAAIASSGATQSDLNESAVAELTRADAALNARYRATMAAMKRMDGIDPPVQSAGPSYQAALLSSQRAWLAFRDSECLMEGYSFRGGSAQRMAVVSCKAALTRARTRQLASLAK